MISDESRVSEPEGYAPNLYRTRRRAALVPDLASFSDVDLEHYREQGYLAVRDALSADQVADALAGLESLTRDPCGVDVQFESWAAGSLDEIHGSVRMDVTRRLMGFANREPRLHALAHDARLISVVCCLAGSHEVRLVQDMALLKPPKGGREKPWHQDNAFFKVAPGSAVVGVWLALDRATPANGCMHVIPRSHRDGPVRHSRHRDWQICDDDVQTSRAVAVSLPRGGALFFDGLLHHGTPTNRTSRRRRALQFHYQPPNVERISPEEHSAIFGDHGKDVIC